MKETFESTPLLPSGSEPHSLMAEVLNDVLADAWKSGSEKFSRKSNNFSLSDGSNNLPNFPPSSSEYICPRAISTPRELSDFGAGLSTGIVDAAHGFIEFMATPDSVSKAIASVGPALGIAFRYYGDKVSANRLSDVIKDGGEMLNFLGDEIQTYGMQSPYERGQTAGRLAGYILVLEAGAGLTRGMLAGEAAGFERTQSSLQPAFGPPPRFAKLPEFAPPGDSASAARKAATGMFADGPAIESLALEGSAADFDRFIASLKRADRVNYKRISKIGSSPEFAELVDNIAERLPQAMQRAIYSRGLEIIPVQTIADVDARLKPGTLGLYAVRDGQRYIFLSEDAHLLAEHCGDPVKTIELTLHHEAAHAMDHLPSGGWSSLESPLKEAFEADFKALDDMTKKRFFYFNGKSSLDRTKKEMVADIVSHRAVPDADPKKGAIVLRSFPRLAKALDNTRKN
jgi:hypothetical protein